MVMKMLQDLTRRCLPVSHCRESEKTKKPERATKWVICPGGRCLSKQSQSFQDSERGKALSRAVILKVTMVRCAGKQSQGSVMNLTSEQQLCIVCWISLLSNILFPGEASIPVPVVCEIATERAEEGPRDFYRDRKGTNDILTRCLFFL